MRFLLISLAIALFSLATACSELTLTKSPEPTDVQQQDKQLAQPQVVQSIESRSVAAESSPSAQLIEDLKALVAAETGIPSHEVSLVSSAPVEWPDACLGIPNSDELCAQVITPGYRVVLNTLDKQYELHTDRAGQNIRMKDEG